MSNLTSSIVRGFGFTVGRTAATALLTPKPVPVKSSTGTGCYSQFGYAEDDVEITYDRNWRKYTIAWYGWIGFLIFPFLNVWFATVRLLTTFVSNTQMHFYNMKWHDHKAPDARYKSGFKEFKILKPVYVKSVEDKPTTRNKVEAVLAFLVSWITTGPITYAIYIVEISK